MRESEGDGFGGEVKRGGPKEGVFGIGLGSKGEEGEVDRDSAITTINGNSVFGTSRKKTNKHS